MKNICLLTFNNPKCGGTDKMCVTLANNLSSKYNIYILSIYGVKSSFFTLNEKTNLMIMFPLASIIKPFKFFTRKLNQKIKKLHTFLEKYQIDCIIDVDIALTEISTPACKELNIKHISWDHYCYKLIENNGIYKKAFDVNSFNQNHIVVLTKENYNYYLSSGLYNKKMLHQIYNPHNELFNQCINHKNTKKIICLSRYHNQKGLDLLLKAWKLVEQHTSEWDLYIYGRKQEEYKKIRKQKDVLRLNNVYLSCEKSNIKSIYENAEIYVLPSRYEGLGLVLLDACNASLPIVSFNCPCGPSEIIKDGENGFLVEQDNYIELARKLLFLMNNKNLRKQFGHKSFEISKNYSQEKFVDQWIQLLDLVNE